jgi:hypothetical protein
MSSVLIIGCNRPENVRVLLLQALRLNVGQIFVQVDYPSFNSRSLEIVHEFDLLQEHFFNYKQVTFWRHTSNLGAAKSITSAITRAFHEVEQLLIIEDDLKVHDNFYLLGWDVLTTLKHDPNFSGFSGFNPFEQANNHSTLFVSNISQTWGWGTWKNTWEAFMIVRENWENQEAIISALDSRIDLSDRHKKFWKRRLSDIEKMPQHIWDFQWIVMNLTSNKMSVYPYVSLTSNIGFDEVSTIKSRFRPMYTPTLNLESVNIPSKYNINWSDIDQVILRQYYRMGFTWPLNEVIRGFAKDFYLLLRRYLRV